MFIIEPCCTQKHWPELRAKLGKDGTQFFHGYGDLSISELFPVMLTRYSEVDMLLVCPSVPDSAAAVLKHWMEKASKLSDGTSLAYVIKHLTIITSLQLKKSPAVAKWKKENPWPDRLTIHNVHQNDTAIILPDIALYGGVNLAHSGHFTALASTNRKVLDALKKTYDSIV